MKKINLAFNITDMLDSAIDGFGNGIFFSSKNILKELKKREEINLEFYCAPNKKIIFERALEKDKIFANSKLLANSKIDEKIMHFEFLKLKNRENKESKIKRFFIKTTLGFLKFYKNINLKSGNTSGYKEIFKNIDVFFSPFQAIPAEIQNIENIKKYTLLHDVIPMILDGYNKNFKKRKSWFYELYRSFNKNDFYFANSQYTKDDFLRYINKFDPHKITVIPLSTSFEHKPVIDSEQIQSVRTKYGIPKDKKYILSLCNLEPRKNVIFTVKNFIEFTKKNNVKDCVLILAGAHWKKSLKQLENITKNSKEILRIGYISDDDMQALYSGACMFVFSSLYEGFGMPVLEAMKCACPVICSNVTSMPEVLDDCGLKINPRCDKELITAFEKMYFDENFRKQCAQKGLERSRKFTWEKCVDTISEEIKKNEIF